MKEKIKAFLIDLQKLYEKHGIIIDSYDDPVFLFLNKSDRFTDCTEIWFDYDKKIYNVRGKYFDE